MALVDELTRRITLELHRTLDQAIRHAVESYIIGDGHDRMSATSSEERFPQQKRRRRGRRAGRRMKTAKASRENRSRTIIDAVAKLGEASIEDVARMTGLDKRGVGSSLHYLAAAGKLKQAASGRYKRTRMARAA